MNNLFEFFSKNNSSKNNGIIDPSTTDKDDQNTDETFPYNEPINEAEILKAIHKLKNNKSPGIDLIVNEHMKNIPDILVPVLKNLFNLIFENGIVPEKWTTGIIKPIYKNKGSPTDPSNYRPITLLSCMGNFLRQ